MKCNPLSWLWGLLPLALLTWVAWLAETPRIEQDLKTRSAAALAQKGLAWATPTFSGRDGSVTGRAVEESEQKQAASVVSDVWGVSSVADRTDVLELIKSYIWSAQARDNHVRLTGYVPNEAMRKEIIGTAKATFPGRAIDDEMKLARGAPEQNRWLGGLTFGMKQLAHLKSGGKVEFEGPAFAIEGEAENANVYKTVKTAMASGLPQGITLKRDKVVAPLAKPYTWGASTKGDQVELTGHVPSERQRDQLLADANKAFPKAKIADRMVIASGEPGDWHKVTASALARLGQMKEGKAELRDTQLAVAGIVEREDLIESVRRSLKSELPSSFKLNDEIMLDPKVKAAGDEARRVAAAQDAARRAAALAAEEAAKHASAEELARRAAAAAAAEQAAKRASAEDAARRAAADEAARRAAAEETARRAAAEAEARRVADLQRQQAGEQAQRLAAEDAGRKAAAEDAARKAVAEEATRKAAAAAQAQRVANEAVLRQQHETANRCQSALREAAKAGSINFQRASADIEPVSFATLNKLADIAKSCPDAVIEIAGHTDNEGEAGRNQRLSQRRAQSVADYLTKAGVPDARLSAIGHGDAQPIAPNNTAEERAKNRRIEFNVKVK